MCQHALCEHGKTVADSVSSSSPTLMPQPPTTASRTLSLVRTVLLLLALLATPFLLNYILSWTIQLTLLVIFIATLYLRMFNYPSMQLTAAQMKTLATEEHQQFMIRGTRDAARHASRLGDAIRIETVSHEVHDPDKKIDYSQLLRMHTLLERNYPLVHKTLERTIVNQYSLIFHWKGRAQPQIHEPYMLCAHLDVVPVPDTHLWTVAPFSGEVKDGFIHGRGAIDDKQAVCGILGAVEDLLESGFVPERDVYLAFGHDEELGGNFGAKEIAKVMATRKVHLSFMIDEGLFVMTGFLQGMNHPTAMICIAEKGYLESEHKVSVAAELAGHASAPASESAIGILSRAMVAMESNPMPSYLIRGSPVRLMFDYLAPHFVGPSRFITCNLWLFAPLVRNAMTKNKTRSTVIRTTTALTVLKAGGKANVMPREATAIINHRIHPYDSVEGVLAYSRSVVNDSRVTITGHNPIPPAPVSSTTSEGFRTIQAALGRVMPEVLVAPSIMVGNTDTHHYWDLSNDIYRFSPTRLDNKTISMFHGVDEKMGVQNFVETIAFYRAVIQIADKGIDKILEKK